MLCVIEKRQRMCYPCMNCGKCKKNVKMVTVHCPKCKTALSREHPICPECGWALPSARNAARS
jgi:hypothetical protein